MGAHTGEGLGSHANQGSGHTAQDLLTHRQEPTHANLHMLRQGLADVHKSLEELPESTYGKELARTAQGRGSVSLEPQKLSHVTGGTDLLLASSAPASQGLGGWAHAEGPACSEPERPVLLATAAVTLARLRMRL